MNEGLIGVCIATGAVLAIIDRYLVGRAAGGVLLVLAAIVGAVGMKLDPFSFAGSNNLLYYVVMIFALLALAVYLMARAGLGLIGWMRTR